jgi:hypothetical protein
MPGIFKFVPFRLTGFHRMVRMDTFNGLHARFLIRTHQMYALFMQSFSLMVQFTNSMNGLAKFGTVVDTLIKPVLNTMGF